MGLAEFVFIVFLILKATEQVEWSWLWVLSPLWICYGIIVPIVIVLWLVFVKLIFRRLK